jgi:hypothetical protein
VASKYKIVLQNHGTSTRLAVYEDANLAEGPVSIGKAGRQEVEVFICSVEVLQNCVRIVR